MDGEEGRLYDNVGDGFLVFSPDSKHFAHVAGASRRMFIVVDGQPGWQYNHVIHHRGRSIIFDSPNSFHYLARRQSGAYLVTEQIK